MGPTGFLWALAPCLTLTLALAAAQPHLRTLTQSEELLLPYALHSYVSRQHVVPRTYVISRRVLVPLPLLGPGLSLGALPPIPGLPGLLGPASFLAGLPGFGLPGLGLGAGTGWAALPSLGLLSGLSGLSGLAGLAGLSNGVGPYTAIPAVNGTSAVSSNMSLAVESPAINATAIPVNATSAATPHTNSTTPPIDPRGRGLLEILGVVPNHPLSGQILALAPASAPAAIPSTSLFWYPPLTPTAAPAPPGPPQASPAAIQPAPPASVHLAHFRGMPAMVPLVVAERL